MTIVRIWRSVTLTTRSEQYVEYLNRIVVPACRIAEGNEGLFVMNECQGELTHFLLLTIWTSSEALARYAGTAGVDVVNPSPDERSLLVAYESTARRYKVVRSLSKIRESCYQPDRHDQTIGQ